jgi:Rrf2 family transcriptional regulator, cysteine metabolism repressor
MRLSAKAQYACVAMVELACNWGERAPVHLKAIAENHGISQRFLVQILLQLKGGNLVESTRGAAGGYQLARSPKEITLADVIHAIDQAPPDAPLALAGLNSTSAVQVVSHCLQEVQVREQNRLAELTLADLVKQTQPTAELSFQI